MKRLLLLLLFLCIESDIFAQITITSAQFLAGFTSGQVSGKAYTSEDMNGLSSLIAAAGANQSWDFGGRVYSEVQTIPGTAIEVFTFPGTAPFGSDPDFATATHVMKISLGSSDLNATWMYVRFTDQGYWLVGHAFDSMGTAKKQVAYVPPQQQYAFPLAYQTEWHSTSQMKGPAYEFYDTATVKVDAKVDGYGNLVLPTRVGKPDHSPSSTTQALRIETKTTQALSIQGFSFSTVSYDYEWITLSQYTASISTDEQKAPQGVSYSTPGSSGSVGDAPENVMEIRIGANPVVAETSISFTLGQPENVNIHVLDMLGNSVQHVASGLGHEGRNIVPLSVHTLPNGTYFLRIEAGGLRAIRKLVVSK